MRRSFEAKGSNTGTRKYTRQDKNPKSEGKEKDPCHVGKNKRKPRSTPQKERTPYDPSNADKPTSVVDRDAARKTDDRRPTDEPPIDIPHTRAKRPTVSTRVDTANAD